jgi:hypothetical protein
MGIFYRTFKKHPWLTLVGSLEGTSSEHPLVEDYSKPTVYSTHVNGESPNGNATPRMNTRSSLRPRMTMTNSAGDGTRQSFNLRRAATSLFTPHKKIGRAPGIFRSIRSIITASCMWCPSIIRDRVILTRSPFEGLNVLLIFIPISVRPVLEWRPIVLNIFALTSGPSISPTRTNKSSFSFVSPDVAMTYGFTDGMRR